MTEEMTQTPPPMAEPAQDAAEIAGTPQKDAPKAETAPPPQKETAKKTPQAKKPPAKKPARDTAQEDALKDAMARISELETTHAQAMKSHEETAAQMKLQAAHHKDALLERLGVTDKYREFAPDVDPFTTKGREALEGWARERPEICRAQAQPSVPEGVKIAEQIKEKPGAFLVDPQAVTESFRHLKRVNR